MLRCNKRTSEDPSGGTVLWPSKMTNKKRKVIPSSAVAVFPDEIMTEVFLRLPIKSILRFRAVCHSWAALLSSEEFCSLHLAATEVVATPPKLLFVRPTANFDSTGVYSCSLSGRGDELLFTLDNARGNFVDVSPTPCHGLTLLYDAVAPAYYVCNAATRAVTQLLPCYDVAFATVGLGFDAQTKKYKVVRFFQGRCYENQRFHCEIYTLGGGYGDDWRPVSCGVPFRFCNFARSAIWNAVFRKMQPVFADGFLHWLIDPSLFAKMPRAAIISFSLTKETFSWVRSPPFVVSGAHLVKFDDHLCMVRDLREGLPAGSMLEIWKLKGHSSGDWSLNLQIDLSGHVPRDFVEPHAVKVIGSFGSCKSSKKIIIAPSKHKVFVYDTLSRTLETIHSTMKIHSSHQSEPYDTRFSLFSESLVPVHKTKEEVALSLPLAKMTEQILLRLPAKSALNFRLVCKQWCRLIKSESFARSFFLHKNMDKRPKIMLVGKGVGQSGFSFTPLNEWIQDPSNKGALLDTKIVCSKPCHGLNLVSIEKKDYLYNPCIGFRIIHRSEGPIRHRMWKLHLNGVQLEEHPFAVGNKNVGLGFNLLTQGHVIVELSIT
jgi:F-box interacting protein